MTRRLLAVDPSIRSCGVALFVDDVFDNATTLKVPKRDVSAAERVRAVLELINRWAPPVSIDEVVCEWPHVYPYGSDGATARPNDLFGLAGVCGALAGMYRCVPVVSYEPSEWGGQMGKAQKRERVLRHLRPFERLRTEKLGQDAIDAVGIGLHHIGRFERRRVFAGATPG